MGDNYSQWDPPGCHQEIHTPAAAELTRKEKFGSGSREHVSFQPEPDVDIASPRATSPPQVNTKLKLSLAKPLHH